MLYKESSKQKLMRLFILTTLFFSVDELRASGIKVDGVDSKFKPTITNSRTNIDQIDIVAPNSNGVSHNKFSDYNVQNSGIILNNSKTDINTQLAGIINGNKNLTGKEADLIITEVIGKNLSNINGFTEIAGKSADYILANPNGINVNGAGFINARNVTLTTGEVLDNLSLQIRKGLITVGEKGINTDGVDYFNLISKTAKITGQINSNKKDTKEIKVVAGSNDYNYITKKLTKVEDKNDKNLVGIDTSELGGMIANRITLISTDKGVGVNTKGVLIADEDNIDITSSGDVVVKKIKSSKDINITGENKTTFLKDGIVVGNNVKVSGKNIEVEGTLYGKNNLKLKADSLETKENGEIVSNENIHLKDVKEINNSGELKSSKNIIIDGKVENHDKGYISGTKVELNKDTKNSGKIVANKTSIDGNTLENNGIIYAEQDLIIKSKNATNKKGGILLGKNEVKIENDKLSNSGRIQGNKKITVKNKELENNGVVYSDNIEVKNNIVNNTQEGSLLAKDKLVIDKKLINHGLAFSNNYVEVKEYTENKGRIAASEIKLKDTSNEGEIESKTIEITGKKLTNVKKGKIKGNKLNVKSDSIVNNGELVGVEDLTVEGKENLENQGKILSNRKISLASKKITNQGELGSNQDLNIKGDILTNSGTIESKKLEITGKELSNIKEGKIKGNRLNINSDSIANKGELIGVEDLTVEGKESLENQGKILSNKKISLTSKMVTNQGEVASNEEIKVESDNLINSGTVESKKLEITGKELSNIKEGKIKGNRLNVKSNSIVNKGELIGVEDLTVKAEEKLENEGKILSNKKISLTSKKIANQGEVVSNEEIKVEGDNLTNSGTIKSQEVKIKTQELENSGNLLAVKNIDVDSSKSVKNEGKIYSKKDIAIKTKDIQNEKEIISNEKISLNSDKFHIAKGEIFSNNVDIDASENDIALTNNIHSAKELKVKAKKIDLKENYENVGDINLTATESITAKNLLSENNINLDSKNLDFKASGKIVSGKNTKIKTSDNLTVNGEIKSYGNIDIHTDGDFSNQGKVLAKEDLKIKGKNITNTGEKTLYSGKNMELVSKSNITNEAGGTILALDGNLKLTAQGDIENKTSEKFDSTIKAGKDIEIKAKSLKNEATIYEEAKIVSKKYTSDEIKKLLTEKKEKPKLKKISTPRGSASALGGGHNVHDYSISNWNELKYENFYNKEEGFEVIDSPTHKNEGNEVKYSLKSTIKINSKGKDIGDKLYQGIIKSDNDIRITTTDTIENKGILSAKNGVILNTKEVKNISEVRDLGERVTSFETEVRAKIKKEYTPTILDLIWDWSPIPEYEVVKEENKIQVEKVLLPAENVASISGKSVNININGGLNNIDSINEDTKGNKISKEDYEKFKKNLEEKELKKIEIDLENSSNKEFIKKLDKLQNEALNIEENKNINEHNSSEISNKEIANIKLEKDVVKEKVLSDKELKKIQDKTSTEKYVEIYKGNSGLFKISENTNKPLIQTNIEFIDLNKYYASDYFFKKIGYKPDEKVRQLGDSYYETSLINKVVVSTFGDKLEDSDKDEATLMKGLLDNAVEESKKNKNLKVGQALSEEDVKNLDKNIVWYVEKEINGVKVLAPQLYVAKTGARGFNSNGSQISGKDINISGAQVVNNGNISAKNRVDIDTISLVNISGASKAKIEGKDTFITAVKDIENIGAEINAENINYIKSTDGNIINESTKKKISTLDGEFFKEKLDNVGKINSGNKVVIDANKDFVQSGSEVKGKDVNIFAKDIKVDSLELREKDKITGGYLTKIKGTEQTIGTSYEANVSKRTNVSSKIVGENNVRLESNNLAVIGSEIKGNNILIDADNVEMKGTKDILDSEYKSRVNTSFYVEKENEKAHIEELNKTKLEAKDNLVINSYGNISLNGVDRKSGGLTTINSKYGNVEEKAEKVNNKIERNSYKLGTAAELDEKDVVKNNTQKLNAKLGFAANPGNETEADNLLNKGFVTQQNLSRYGASGSATIGFTQRTVDEKINEEKYVQNNIEAKNQKIQARYDVVRKGFKENIEENSNVESKEGNIRLETTQNRVEKSKKETAFSIGTEYGYRVPVLTIAENIGKRAEYERESKGSVLNAVKNNKESIGVAGDVALRTLETIGDLSKLNAGTDIATVYSKTGLTYSSVDKNSVSTDENKNESKVGNSSSYIAKNNVSMTNTDINTKNLNVEGENFILNSGESTSLRTENGYSNSVDLEGNMGVDIDGGNVGAQINIDSSTVIMNSKQKDNLISKINVEDKFNLKTSKDAKIKGKIVAKDFKGDIGNKLEIVSLQDTKTESSTNINANASAGAVLSTNGITPTANIGITTGIGKENKSWTQEQSGIVAKENFDLNVKDTIELKGALLGSLKDNKTNIKAKKLVATDLEDSHVKAGGYTGGGFGVGKKGISTINVKVGTSEGFVKNQISKSTVGTGDIKVENDISNINRDLSKTQETTKDFVISKYDLDFSIHKKSKAQKNTEDEIKQKNKVEEEHIYEEIQDVSPIYSKAKSTEEHIYEEIPATIYSRVGSPVYSKVGEKEEVVNPLYVSKEKASEEHIYEEIPATVYSKVGSPVYSKVGEKEEVVNPLYVSKEKASEEHIYEEIPATVYSRVGSPVYSKVGEKEEVVNPLYVSKEKVSEEHIYEEIPATIYSRVGSPVYSKVGEKEEVVNPLYVSKEKVSEEHIYEEIPATVITKDKTNEEINTRIEKENPIYETSLSVKNELNSNNNNNVQIEKVAVENKEITKPKTIVEKFKGLLSKFTTKKISENLEDKKEEIKVTEENIEPKVTIEKNIATKHKVDRLTSELEELNNSKLELDSKFNQFVSTNKKLNKMQKQIEKLENKLEKLGENSNNKKIEKLQLEIENKKSQLNEEVKKVNSTLMDKYEDIKEKNLELTNKLNNLEKENLVLLKSEVELSEANHEVLKSPQVFEELKKQYKSKFGIDIEAQGVKPEETSVVKLEKKALNKMVYEVTPSEREAILEKIKEVPKVKSENISKDIADSVILSSKTLSKNKDLQDKVQNVVEEFLKSGNTLTIDSLAKLNKEIRVEEAEDNKQIFKTDHLTKEGAVFTDPIVSKQYLENFVEWYNKTSATNELEGLEKAALAYQRLMTYHPFAEGNGRITRVIVNKILLENGYTTLPKFSDDLTKKVLPQSSERKGEESYSAKEFVDSFISEIKANTKQSQVEDIKTKVVLEEKMDTVAEAINKSHTIAEKEKVTIEEVNKKELAEDTNGNNNNNKTIVVNKENIGEITPMKDEYKKLFQEAKEKYKNRDSNEEALKKLDTLAKNVKNIPKEHLVKAIEELNFGLKMEDITKLQKQGRETNKKVIKPDTIEELNSKGQKNIAKIYNQLDFDKKYVDVREEINNTTFNKLVENPEFNQLMKSKLSGDKEKIEKLFSIVEQAKHDSLKEVTGIEGERATVKIDENATSFKLGQGFYDEKKSQVNMNIVPLGGFLRSTQSNNREILDTIIHELTHHDQNQFVKHKAKNKIKNENIAADVSTDVSLFTVNQLHYVQGNVGNIKNYKKQPLEREAFKSGHDLSKKLTKYLKEQEKNEK